MTTVLVSANSSWNIVHFRAGLLRELADSGYGVVVAAPPDQHSDRIREMGFDFHPLPMSRSGMNPVADAILLVRYRRLMREIRPHAFLGYTIKPNLYGSLAAAEIGASVINTITGLGTSFLQSHWLKALAMRLYKTAFRRSHRVFFQNRTIFDLFLRDGIVAPAQQRWSGVGIELIVSGELSLRRARFPVHRRWCAKRLESCEVPLVSGLPSGSGVEVDPN